MIDGNPYLVERLMKIDVRQAHREAEASRLCKESRAGAQGSLARMGRRLFQQSGQTLHALGSWLEEHGVPAEEALDSQMKPVP